jgi:hypothetical protein
MGERVFVRTSPVEPIDSGPRIDYAKPDVNPHFPTVHKAIAWVHYVADTVWQVVRPLASALVQQLGGRRQVVFALGMMFAVGGFGAAVSRSAFPVFVMCIGGALMGLMIPLSRSRRKD